MIPHGWIAICTIVLSLSAGCGQGLPLANVKGIVLIDGQPLPNVLVTFVPEAAGASSPVRSMGMSDAAGQFTLRAETQQPGALIGTHRVTVEDLSILDAPRKDDGTVISVPPQRFPSLYSDSLRTPLRATVEATEVPIALELTTKATRS